MKMLIGNNIKRLRTNKNITQEQLSDAMNVTCAAVSKWERGETYPDITLLQPLAYFFGVSLDELMGYDREKIQAEIKEVLAYYKSTWKKDWKKAREIITKAYHDYPNDYWVMHYYMCNIGGDMSDNDSTVLLEHKDEFLSICNKIIDGCTEESLRLNAWNMRAKICYAEGKTEEAMEIYRSKFTNWYHTLGQKSEQLFAKNTSEYYYWVQKNMYELAEFAGDKLGKVVFFDAQLSIQDKVKKALKYGEWFLTAAKETNEAFFAIVAHSFLGRMNNDLIYRGGTDADTISIMNKYLVATQRLTELSLKNTVLFEVTTACHDTDNLLKCTVDRLLNTKHCRMEELLNNPEYAKILNKYNSK